MRQAEDLNRGVVAVQRSRTEVLVTWRLLGLDPGDIAFEVYRSSDGGEAEKLNDAPITDRTNFRDTTAVRAATKEYFVVPVADGVAGDPSPSFELTANHAVEPIVRVGLREGDPIKYLWVGDLDGDGTYDYVVDRQSTRMGLEAYRSDGTFLWEMDLGRNSENQYNIEPGSATIDVGHWDGVTVQDLDGDGRSEVAVRIANGVTFGDGEVYESLEDDTHQSMAVLDGRTGALRASAPLPDDYLQDGPLAARLGVGFLDGENASIVGYFKNRIGSGAFNLMIAAWRFDGQSLTEQWKWLRGDTAAGDGHNTRIVDVDGDGKDEIAEVGFVLNGDGTLRYSLADSGIGHGDRFHIADIDPERPGLEGYGVQQNNQNLIHEYVYDAATGEVSWQHEGDSVADIGRGVVGDIDPGSPGIETWAFSGLRDGRNGDLVDDRAPWPDTAIWWDGDLSRELLNERQVNKWRSATPDRAAGYDRLVSTYSFGAVGAKAKSDNALFQGDILGDWREEIVLVNRDFDELMIFTSNVPTAKRLYTLPHNPAYRNAMTLKGYVQTPHVDYFLGAGMETPAAPSIRYAD